MYGVIDIGSNTIRLVVYKVENNNIVSVFNKKASVGLAGYINKCQCINKKGVQKAIKTLKSFEEVINLVELEDIFVFATASLRNIDNRDAVIKEIQAATSFKINVLSGHEEALFDYYGAIQSTDIQSGMLVDIGGGSTELVFFEDKEVVATKSLPIGSLNMYNKYVGDLIPTKKEMRSIKKETIELLDTIELPLASLTCQPICGVGGTARAIKSFLSDIKEDEVGEYSCHELKDIITIAKEEPKTFVKLLIKSSPDRIHTFVPGLIILQTISKYYKTQSIITSEYGVREGYLYYLLEKRGIFHDSNE